MTVSRTGLLLTSAVDPEGPQSAACRCKYPVKSGTMAQTPQDILRATPSWRDAHAKTLTSKPLYTLSQLHSELAGKLGSDRREAYGCRSRHEDAQPEDKPEADRSQAAQRGNPWFKRGTLGSVIGTLRRSPGPMTTRQIAGKERKASRNQPMVLQAAVLATAEKRVGRRKLAVIPCRSIGDLKRPTN
jgi:hypothetical protein